MEASSYREVEQRCRWYDSFSRHLNQHLENRPIVKLEETNNDTEPVNTAPVEEQDRSISVDKPPPQGKMLPRKQPEISE